MKIVFKFQTASSTGCSGVNHTQLSINYKAVDNGLSFPSLTHPSKQNRKQQLTNFSPSPHFRCFTRTANFMHVINHDDDDCENVHINCCNVIFGPIVSGSSAGVALCKANKRRSLYICGSRRLCVTWQFRKRNFNNVDVFTTVWGQRQLAAAATAVAQKK